MSFVGHRCKVADKATYNLWARSADFLLTDKRWASEIHVTIFQNSSRTVHLWPSDWDHRIIFIVFTVLEESGSSSLISLFCNTFVGESVRKLYCKSVKTSEQLSDSSTQWKKRKQFALCMYSLVNHFIILVAKRNWNSSSLCCVYIATKDFVATQHTDTCEYLL